MTQRKPKIKYVRHPDDRGIDTVHFVDGMTLPKTQGEVEARSFLRIVTRERYKTSELSGDEWRFSAMLQANQFEGDVWANVSGPYHDIETYLKALYAELYGDFRSKKKETQWLFKRRVASICFSWKGNPVYSASDAGESTDLLVAAGHASWALILASERGWSGHAYDSVCCQPGCVNKPVSKYRKIKDYSCRTCGNESSIYRGNHVRVFCLDHLRRGNCGLDDSDANYEVVAGPGPEQGEPSALKKKPSLYGGSIELKPGDLS